MITAMPRIAIAVEDFEETVATFRESFGMPVVDASAATVKSLGVQVGMCVPEGGSNIELMSPSDTSSPLGQSLRRFLDRRGEGPFALMLEAADPNAEAAGLTGRGLDVLPLMEGAGGRDVHPRSTHGVLVRVYPTDSFTDRNDDPVGSPEISGIARVVVAVNDAEEASAVYANGFGLTVGAPIPDEDRGVLTVTCTPPTGGAIELVSPLDTARPFARRIETFLSDGQEGMHAFVLHADDPREAGDALEAKGIEVNRDDGVEALAFGTPMRIEQR